MQSCEYTNPLVALCVVVFFILKLTVLVAQCCDFPFISSFVALFVRYPYLLQNDSTLTNTLLCYGWQHRVRIKHEPNSAHYNTVHANGSSSSRAGTGMVNNSFFLWETSSPMENDDTRDEEDDMDLMDETESCIGVWYVFLRFFATTFREFPTSTEMKFMSAPFLCPFLM